MHSQSTQPVTAFKFCWLSQTSSISLAMSTVQRSPLGLPTALAQGGLGCLEGKFTRDTAWEATPDEIPRHRRASQFIRRSYVKEQVKCCTSTSVAAAFTSAPLVVTFSAFLTFVLVRRRSSFGCRWSVSIILPMSSGPSLTLPSTIRIGIPRLSSLIPS